MRGPQDIAAGRVAAGAAPGLLTPGQAAPGQMTRRRIGILGGGVAGLTAAYVLSRDADVTVIEAEPRLGGHAHTHRLTDPDGSDLWVDSGFIVHNRTTYPLLTRLFTELGV